MDPMAVDMLGCLDVDQCSDKTLLAGAGSLASTGHVLSDGGVPYVSEVIQSSLCTLMAKWLFGGFGVRALAKLISRRLEFKLEDMNCKAAVWP